MPKIHVIYDPRDMLSHNPELDKRVGIKVAILSISNNLSNDEIEEIAMQLSTLLLEQIVMDKEPRIHDDAVRSHHPKP